MGLGSTSSSKTKELIIYVAGKLAQEKTYGATLLAKALYFIDNINYLQTGSPISDLKYVKQEFGPTPEPSQFLSLRDDLVRTGAMEIEIGEYFGRPQKRLLPKRTSELKYFQGTEIALIDNVLHNIRDLNASEASELTHKFPAWEVANNKEALPLYTFLISCKEPSQEDIDWAHSKLDGIPGCER